MKEALILGLIQGVAEWLPVSSEALIVLARIHLFGAGEGLEETLHWALFLHFGTFLAALCYFYRPVGSILREVLRGLPEREGDIAHITRFLIWTTLISGILGYGLKEGMTGFKDSFALTGRGITLIVGVLLLITGGLQLYVREWGLKGPDDLSRSDGVLLGVAQGLAVLPGLSRSGLTVSMLLLRRFRDTHSLRLSFLMSLPIVLAGNLILNWDKFMLTGPALVSLAAAFVAGLATIHLLLKVARAVSFGYFVIAFGAATIIAAFL